MKRIEKCSGRGYRMPPGPPESRLLVKGFGNLKQKQPAANWVDLLSVYFLMGLKGFDRAESIEVDSTVGDDRKSSKIINANDAFYTEELALAA